MRTLTTLLLLLFLLYNFMQANSSEDTLNTSQNIPRTRKTLVSAGQKFELGFFSPLENPTQSYLGIWYKNNRTNPGKPVMVWVANRDNPVLDSHGGGIFKIAQDGNLIVANSSGSTFWSSKLNESSSSNRTVKLTDSGNLVLFQHDNDRDGTSYIVWQSFQYPTDTFLPGMEMDRAMELTSWRYDGGGGGRENFTFKMAQSGNNLFLILDNQNQLHWENNGLDSDALSPDVFNYFANFTGTRSNSRYANKETWKSFYDTYQDTRIVMNSTGELQFWRWEESEWIMTWKQPSSTCNIHNFCGNFSSCNVDDWMPCKCLPGFRLASEYGIQSYEMGMEFPGCVRESEYHEDNRDMVFLNLPKIRLGKPDQMVNNVGTEERCKFLCYNMSHPQCQAYAYNTTNNDRIFTSSSCGIWTNDLTTLQVDQDAGGDLAVLVKSSDMAPTGGCNPCGIYTIPYPLSTEPNCGDPEYYKFNCSYSTGQVSFLMPGGQLKRVTWIDENARKFYIEADETFHCDYIYQNDKPDPPFNVTNWCFKENQIEISWQPPLERPCNKTNDCIGFPHSTCRPTTEGKNRCLCDPKFQWNASISTCTQDEKSRNHLGESHLILIVTLTGVIFLVSTMIFAYTWRKKAAPKIDRENIQIQESLYDSDRHVKGLIGLGRLEEKDSKGIEVPFYTFGSIVAATDNFSDSNKLGQGGYGPVYKGSFPGGQDIAVKRLSSVSNQGLEEFKNEIVLIAKLQHRNLVRLRGYCIKGDEKILLYEYMPNKSLDSFIFDRTRTLLLNWQMRFDIILGIARGLLYLHQDSILRVIHRDLKTSNILLDKDMTPKISDFGLAKIFGGKEVEANTQRVVGTYGYMAPEYALDGFFSIKSDVFSFGVVLLEILSGKKNTGFYQFKQTATLLGYAWGLWTENRLMDLMDASFSGTCNENQFIKCAHIVLLCVQDEPGDRPTMSSVVTMLDSEIATIPIPSLKSFGPTTT